MNKEELVPKLRFEEFRLKWNLCGLLDSVTRVIDFRGRTPKKLGLDWSPTGFLALSALNVKNGYIAEDTDAHYGDRELYNKWMLGNELHKGQVLFTTEAPMGNVAQIPDNNKYILSQRTIAFEVNNNWIIEDYLAVALRTPRVFRNLTTLSSGGTAKGVSQRTLSELDIPIPKDTEEQKKIGKFFKKIDKMIQLQQSKVNKVKDIKSAYLCEMFPKEGEKYPKKRFEGYTEPWIERELRDLGDIITGTTPSTKNEAYYSKNGVPWVTPTDIYKNITYVSKTHLSKAGQKVSKIVPKNTILITSIASIGKNTLLGRSGSFNQQINALVPDTNMHNPYFLFTQSVFWSAAMKQTAASGTMQIVNKTEFSKITTKVPVLDEQIKIADFFKNLDNQISTEEEKLAKLEELKQAYLNDMFV